jgi:hypothetical protein
MAKSRITLGIALIVVALAAIGREYPWIVIPLVLVAVFLILWGRESRATEQFIAALPGGRYILKGLHQVDLIISPRDQEYERHLRTLIAGYPEIVRISLVKLRTTRAATSIPESHWQQFRHDGLVDHPHSGPGPIKEDLREIVGRILDDLGGTSRRK